MVLSSITLTGFTCTYCSIHETRTSSSNFCHRLLLKVTWPPKVMCTILGLFWSIFYLANSLSMIRCNGKEEAFNRPKWGSRKVFLPINELEFLMLILKASARKIWLSKHLTLQFTAYQWNPSRDQAWMRWYKFWSSLFSPQNEYLTKTFMPVQAINTPKYRYIYSFCIYMHACYFTAQTFEH